MFPEGKKNDKKAVGHFKGCAEETSCASSNGEDTINGIKYDGFCCENDYCNGATSTRSAMGVILGVIALLFAYLRQ